MPRAQRSAERSIERDNTQCGDDCKIRTEYRCLVGATADVTPEQSPNPSCCDANIVGAVVSLMSARFTTYVGSSTFSSTTADRKIALILAGRPCCQRGALISHE